MYRSLHLCTKKLNRRGTISANSSCRTLRRRRLFVLEKLSKSKFLIDSGAEVSLLPPEFLEKQKLTHTLKTTDITLVAANNSPIKVHGEAEVTLDLNLGRRFTFSFTVAQVPMPIIGADFLHEFHLCPDLRRELLLDFETNKSRPAISTMQHSQFHIKVVSSRESKYTRLLAKFPAATQPGCNAPRLRQSPEVAHLIETTGRPVHCQPRRLDAAKLQAAKQEFSRLEKEGIVRRSNSNWASPLQMVKKPNGTWRCCGDYRALNAITVPDRYPIPHIEDFAQSLNGCKLFSAIDLPNAFHQIPMHRAHTAKTAIRTPFGLFEFLKMPFGLRNASQTFQRHMDEVLKGLHFTYNYIDDILVASKSEEEHFQHLEQLLARLQQHGLKINPAKCVFGKEELNFLGYTVNSSGIKPPASKVQAIGQMKPPLTAHGLRRFIGIINYYRRCIPNASQIVSPLWDLVKNKTKNQPIEWNETTLNSFQVVKKSLSDALLIHHPHPQAKIQLTTDASDVAVGATLEQVVNGQVQPIGLFSRKFEGKKKALSAYDRELEAIYLSIKHFKHLLDGIPFVIFTDHRPITYAFQQKPEVASPKQRKMLDYISQFTTDIRHISGSRNTVADALSRIEANAIPTPLNQLILDIAEAQKDDPEVKQLLGSSSTALSLKPTSIPGTGIKIICDFSTSTPRPFVPIQLRKSVFNSIHNLAHPGIRGTRKMVKERYIWPNIDKDLNEWTRSCIPCQKSKVTRHNKPQLGTFTEPDARFSHIHMDIVGPLPPARGHTHLLTIVDRFSKWMDAIPLKDTSAETIAENFLHHWIAKFGCPKVITTDRGSNLTAAVNTHLYNLFGIQHNKTTPYHPSANGIIERTHRVLKSAIKAHEKKDWYSILPLILLGIRSSIKEDIGYSPAELVYGTQLRLPGDFFEATDLPLVTHGFVSKLHDFMANLQPPRARRHGQPKIFLHRNLRDCTHVFLQNPIKGALKQPYTGPFEVISKHENFFTILKNKKEERVSIENIKPAFTLNDTDKNTQHTQPKQIIHPLPPEQLTTHKIVT